MIILPPFIQDILFHKSKIPFFIMCLCGGLLVLATQKEMKILTTVLMIGLPYLVYTYRKFTEEYVLFIEHLRSYESRILSATSIEELDEVSFDLSNVLQEDRLGGEARHIRKKLMELLPVRLKHISNHAEGGDELTKEACRSMSDEILSAHRLFDKLGIPVDGLSGEEPLLVKRLRYLIYKQKNKP